MELHGIVNPQSVGLVGGVLVPSVCDLIFWQRIHGACQLVRGVAATRGRLLMRSPVMGRQQSLLVAGLLQRPPKSWIANRLEEGAGWPQIIAEHQPCTCPQWLQPQQSPASRCSQSQEGHD